MFSGCCVKKNLLCRTPYYQRAGEQNILHIIRTPCKSDKHIGGISAQFPGAVVNGRKGRGEVSSQTAAENICGNCY